MRHFLGHKRSLTKLRDLGKSGIIEKSAIDGQKQFHDDLDVGIRAYISEHASDFAGQGGEEDIAESETSPNEKGKPEKPSEAETYAAEQRQKRQDKDVTYLQWAADSVVFGLGMIGTGLKTAVDAIGDMVGGKEAILGSVIALLIISNIWTYYSVNSGDGASMRRAKRLGKGSGMRDDEVAEALRLVLDGRGGGAMVIPREEVGMLRDMLDEVERRAIKLREMVDSSVGGEDLE